MRKNVFSALLGIVLISFTSCEKNEFAYVTVDFEDVALTGDSILNDSSFTTGGMTFQNVLNDWGFWRGMAASAKNDMLTPGYLNDLSVYAPKAASGRKFAVAYEDDAICSFPIGMTNEIKEIKLNNGTYAFLSMKNGDDFAKKFVAGDWFKVTIYGYNSMNSKTDSVEYFLADFRNGKSYICDKWTTVKLSDLGKVNKISFSFSSSDNGEYGMNTPAYVCIDDITYLTELD